VLELIDTTSIVVLQLLLLPAKLKKLIINYCWCACVGWYFKMVVVGGSNNKYSYTTSSYLYHELVYKTRAGWLIICPRARCTTCTEGILENIAGFSSLCFSSFSSTNHTRLSSIREYNYTTNTYPKGLFWGGIAPEHSISRNFRQLYLTQFWELSVQISGG